MQKSGEFSLLRNLAVALGEGMAFRVGMRLTDRVADRIPPAEAGPNPVELSPSPGDAALDQRAIAGLAGLVDVRFQKYGDKIDSRIADAEARITVEIGALDRRVQSAEETAGSLRGYVDNKATELRGQVVAINHEFAQAVAGIVRQEVARQVEMRAAALERTLRDQLRQLVNAALEQRGAANSKPGPA